MGSVTLLRWIREPEGFTRVLHGLANACTDTCPDTQENLPGFVLGKLRTGQGELWEDILGVRLPRRKSSYGTEMIKVTKVRPATLAIIVLKSGRWDRLAGCPA